MPYAALFFSAVVALLASAGRQPLARTAPRVEQDSAARAQIVPKAPSPFVIGEKLEYQVKYGFIKAGTATMEVVGIDNIRGRQAYHTRFTVKGGVPLLIKVNDLLESWIDTATFASLRFNQSLDEGPHERERRYEIFPERSAYRELTDSATAATDQPSVENPLDDGSFLYFIRTVPLKVGDTLIFNRYFKPDRNPVKIIVLRKEDTSISALGIFPAIVIQPIIKAKGLFSEDGEAKIWLSDDNSRMILKLQSNFGPFNLNLELKSIGNTRTPPRK